MCALYIHYMYSSTTCIVWFLCTCRSAEEKKEWIKVYNEGGTTGLLNTSCTLFL